MRPIDADALVSDIESVRNMFFHSPYERRFHEDRIEFALNMVEDVPTLDYAPVRHGEWIKIPGSDKTCSKCGEEYPTIDHRGFLLTDNFCPNCGAKMDGGKIHEY